MDPKAIVRNVAIRLVLSQTSLCFVFFVGSATRNEFDVKGLLRPKHNLTETSLFVKGGKVPKLFFTELYIYLIVATGTFETL